MGVCRRRYRGQNAGGGGVAGKKLRGGYAGEGTEDKMQGGCCGKKIEGGRMPERVKKTKCGGGWGCCEKNLRGRYAGEGREDEMRGGGGGGWRVNCFVFFGGGGG